MMQKDIRTSSGQALTPLCRVVAASLVVIVLAGCAAGVDREPYPVDRSITLADEQRRDFVDSFLQGRWCEARSLFESSVENSIRRDDMCGAARTARLAARLKAYVGIQAPETENAAASYAKAGGNCPELQDIPTLDTKYTAMIDADEYAQLATTLASENDSLYASVYARKGARKALASGQNSDALTLAETARAVDARHGWVAFLREDWRLMLELETDPETRQAIGERIEILERRITPCP